jgi:hypothetical protein
MSAPGKFDISLIAAGVPWSAGNGQAAAMAPNKRAW